MDVIKHIARFVVPLMLAVWASFAPAAAQNPLGERLIAATAHSGASPWDVSLASRMRLISAQTGTLPLAGETALGAGIEITLDDGWKTYWRNPGDTGIAPMFDFSRSVNVASVDVAYPMPQRFDLPGDISFGYKTRVVFPLAVTPQVPGLPVKLVADIVYGACEELCIPVEATTQLELATANAGTTAFAADIARWRGRVPAPHDAALARVEPIDDETGTSLHVTVQAGAPLTNPVLIAELTGGPARIWLGEPDTRIDGKSAVFVFPVKIRKGGPGLGDGAKLAFTFADMPDETAGLPQWSQHFDFHLAPQ